LRQKIYLHSTPLAKAQALFWQSAENVYHRTIEEVSPRDSMGRITASTVMAGFSSPHYFASAVDGMAVQADHTYGATETSPLKLRPGETAFPVDTGQPLPEGCNAVVMIEHVEWTDQETIEIRSAATPWQHVRAVGEDILGNELILPSCHRVRPVDLGVMLSAGVNTVPVLKKPRVAIIPTGSELVPPGEKPAPGKIIDSNSSLFASMIEEWGGDPIIYPITPDEPGKIKSAMQEAIEEAELVLIIAGSSAGRKDYTAKLVQELGELLVHGVAIRPGKPVVLGYTDDAALLGVPGYPVSAFLVMELFVKPLLYRWLNQPLHQRAAVKASFKRKIMSTLKEEEFLRVRLGVIGGRQVAVPLPRGSGILSSVLKADGLVRIPQETEGWDTDTEVSVELLKPQEEAANNIICLGSHDLSLDLLDNQLRTRFTGTCLASIHEGSLGGIMALKRGETHLAPVHLLDPQTGEYNISYLKQYLPHEDLVLVHLLYREQGLILPPGNPQNIKGVSDLVDQKANFINRQRGAGTRILFDYLLGKEGVDPSSIQGYHREEYNHLAVAAAVQAGTADAGLGILAAAHLYGLHFVPLAWEKYQLVIPRNYLAHPGISRLLDTVATPEFKDQVEKMGGYDMSDRGKIVWESRKEP